MTKTNRYETLEGRKDDTGTGAGGPAAGGGGTGNSFAGSGRFAIHLCPPGTQG